MFSISNGWMSHLINIAKVNNSACEIDGLNPPALLTCGRFYMRYKVHLAKLARCRIHSFL